MGLYQIKVILFITIKIFLSHFKDITLMITHFSRSRYTFYFSLEHFFNFYHFSPSLLFTKIKINTTTQRSRFRFLRALLLAFGDLTFYQFCPYFLTKSKSKSLSEKINPNPYNHTHFHSKIKTLPT